jgi:hypothetical protein
MNTYFAYGPEESLERSTLPIFRSRIDLYLQARLPDIPAGRITEVRTNTHALRLLVGDSEENMAAGVHSSKSSR